MRKQSSSQSARDFASPAGLAKKDQAANQYTSNSSKKAESQLNAIRNSMKNLLSNSFAGAQDAQPTKQTTTKRKRQQQPSNRQQQQNQSSSQTRQMNTPAGEHQSRSLIIQSGNNNHNRRNTTSSTNNNQANLLTVPGGTQEIFQRRSMAVNASQSKLYQIEPGQLFERNPTGISTLTTPNQGHSYAQLEQRVKNQSMQQNHQPQIVDYNVPKIFMSLSHKNQNQIGIQQNIIQSTFNSQAPLNQVSTPAEVFLQSTQSFTPTQMNEEVMPDGVNRPNSLDLQQRHGNSISRNSAASKYGLGTTASQKISHTLSLYEQLRQSSGLNPFKIADGDSIATPLRKAPSVFKDNATPPEETTPLSQSQQLDRKITDILGKYFSPQRLPRLAQEQQSLEYQKLKQISETLHTKLDTLQQSLQPISKPLLPPLTFITTETQTQEECPKTVNEEELDELKIENMRVQEKLTQEKRAALREQELMNEHLKHYQGQIVELQGEVKQLQDRLKLKREVEDKERAREEALNQEREALIKQLTVKLQEQARKAKELKQEVKAGEERLRHKESEVQGQLDAQALEFVEKERQMNEQWEDKVNAALGRQRNEYEGVIKQMNAEIEQNKKACQDIKGFYEQQRSQLIEECKRQLEEIQGANANLVKELQGKQQTLERKDSEYIKTRDRLSNLERDLMSLKDQNRQLKQEAEDQQILIDTLRKNETQSKGTLEQHISKLKEQASGERDKRKAIEAQFEELEQKFNQMKEFGKAKLEALEAEKAEQLDLIHQQEADIERLKEEKATLFARQQSLEQQSSAQLAEVKKSLMEQVDDKSQQIRELEALAESLQQEVQRLQPKLEKKRQSISMIKQQSDLIQSEIRVKEGQLEMLNKQYEQEIRLKNLTIEDLNERMASALEDTKKQKQHIIEMEQQIASQREALVKGNEAMVEQLQRQVTLDKQHMQSDMQQLQQQKDQITEKLRLQKEKYTETKKQHEQELSAVKERLNMELDLVKGKVTEANSELIAKVKENQSLQLQIQHIADQMSREVQMKQHEIEDLNSKNRKLQNELDDRERQIKDQEATIKILENQSTDMESKQGQIMVQLQGTIHALQSELQKKESEIGEVTELFQTQIDRLQQQNQETVKSLHLQLTQLKDAQELKEIELKRTQEQVALQESLSRKLTEQLQQTQESLIEEKQHLNRQINKLIEDKSGVEKELIQSRNELEICKQQKAALQEKAEKKKEKLSGLKQVVASTNEESGQLKQQLTDVQKELQTKIQESIKEMMTKSQQIEKQKREHENVKDNLENQVSDLQRLIQQIQSQKKERETDFESELRRLNDKLAEEKQRSEQNISDIEERLNLSRRELRDAQAELEQARGEIERLKLIQSQKGLAVDQQSEHIERLSKQILGLQKEIREREDVIAQTAQLGQQREKVIIANYSEQIKALQIQNQQAVNEIQQQLQDSKLRYDELNRQQESLKTQFATAQSERDQYSQQIFLLTEDKQAQFNDLSQRKTEIDTLKHQYSALQEKTDRKRQKLRSLKAQFSSSNEESSILKSQLTEVSTQLQAKIGEALKETMAKNQQIEKLKSDNGSIKSSLEGQVADLQKVMQQIQAQKKEREEKLEGEILRLNEKSMEEKQNNTMILKEMQGQMEQAKKELRDTQLSLEQVKGENERLKLSHSEKGLAVDQQTEHIERLSKKVIDLQKEVRDREDMITQITQQTQQKHKEEVNELTQKLQQLTQENNKTTTELQSQLQQLQQKFTLSQQKCDQLTQMSSVLNTSLIEKEQELTKLKQEYQSASTNLTLLKSSTDTQDLKTQLESMAEKNAMLSQKCAKLQKELEEASSSQASEQQVKPLVEELRKKSQLVMIKEAEIESLKVMNKELRATVEQNDMSKELQDVKKQLQFAGKEKEMKDIMIEQLKKEIEKNMVQLVESKEKEAQMAAVINALTVQNAMIGATKQQQQSASSQAKPESSPLKQQKKGAPGKPNVSLF